MQHVRTPVLAALAVLLVLCSLVAHRDDLVPAGGDDPDLTACRLCKPV